MEIIGVLYVGAARLSASQEVHRQPGIDGRDRERGKPGGYGSLVGDLVVEVQGADPSGAGAVGDCYEGGRAG